MAETIYTIPINGAFDEKNGCPLCRLTAMLENNEIERILGAAMMEPDVRLATNRDGFCAKHCADMLGAGKKLPLALTLRTHLSSLEESFSKSPEAAARRAREVSESCYICNRINGYLEAVYNNLFALFADDAAFREKFAAQELFCLPHYSELVTRGKIRLKKPDYKKLCDCAAATEKKALVSLGAELDSFTAMFDYRNAGADWGEFRSAPARAAELIGGRK